LQAAHGLENRAKVLPFFHSISENKLAEKFHFRVKNSLPSLFLPDGPTALKKYFTIFWMWVRKGKLKLKRRESR
jgi:hypothetical protein